MNGEPECPNCHMADCVVPLTETAQYHVQKPKLPIDVKDWWYCFREREGCGAFYDQKNPAPSASLVDATNKFIVNTIEMQKLIQTNLNKTIKLQTRSMIYLVLVMTLLVLGILWNIQLIYRIWQ